MPRPTAALMVGTRLCATSRSQRFPAVTRDLWYVKWLNNCSSSTVSSVRCASSHWAVNVKTRLGSFLRLTSLTFPPRPSQSVSQPTPLGHNTHSPPPPKRADLRFDKRQPRQLPLSLPDSTGVPRLGILCLPMNSIQIDIPYYSYK